MEKKDIIAFFDRCAPTWDAEMIKSDAIIGKIMDHAEIYENMDVLDVACGTGVLFDHYLSRGVRSVTGIDISPEMAKIAAEKYSGESRIQIICGDVEEYPFDRKFDRIVVYNAFPHFPDPAGLIRILAGLLKEGGRLTVAHGASRETIDGHHSGAASKVSMGLMPAEQLSRIFRNHLCVEVMVSNSRMYQVSGVKAPSHTHSTGETADVSEELLAMMNYLVSHNDAHIREVTNLARELMESGNESACLEILDAAADFETANGKLAAVLNKLIPQK